MERQNMCTKIKWSVLLFLTAMLVGCSGKPLSDRAIVRAIFFLQTGEQYRSVLLLQDQQGDSPDSYMTADGKGKTAAQALADATSGLDGEVFYGAMDTVTFPFDSDWQTVQELTQLINETAQPSPEVSLFFLDKQDTNAFPEAAGKIYEELLQCEKLYGLQFGLETVSAQEGVAILPAYQEEEGYGVAILGRGKSPLFYKEPVAAQLAAVLCRQSGKMKVLIQDKTISCESDTSVTIRATPEEIQVILRLTDSKLTSLTEPISEETLEVKFTEDLQTAFSKVMNDVETAQIDPFRLTFWEQCLLGKAVHLPVRLIVEYL